MTITTNDALRELGVTTGSLSSAEANQLDQDGYLVMPGVLSKQQAQRMATRLDALGAEEGENAGKDFHTEKGAVRLGALVNKDPAFDVCFTHPRALAAVAHIMGEDFGVSSLTGRAAMPGEGHQGLHRDNMERCANALWVLSDFTADNGATRLVPRSHRNPGAPGEVMDDPNAPHPDEILLTAPAGTLVVINGWTWHGGTRNSSPNPRHLVSAFFTRRGRYQDFTGRWISRETHDRLSSAALYVLDHQCR